MYHKMHVFLFVFFAFLFILPFDANAQDVQKPVCTVEDSLCMLEQLETTASDIDNVAWRDQTYRELAKSYTKARRTDKAIALIDKIETPDTKAMTIRGIGMEAAQLSLSPEVYEQLFNALRANAKKIEHPPSYAIALTYIAMAQAFAGDNNGAWKTASEMENDALRHKAYGETAEIQAEKGDYKAAMISIGKIDSAAFRNKAYHTVSGIFADQSLYTESYSAALAITNAYKKAQAIQYLFDKKTAAIEKGGSP